ncbi:hypothetical protein BRAO375_1840039 [Bradyrhizobium sp. ORS 375]|nr:hypothetical protein BRAO375_1840039 [Bradyrhizobium sp. ORS 375]
MKVRAFSHSVMPGLVPGIHVVLSMPDDVDGRDKPGHDDGEKNGSKTAFVNPKVLAKRGTAQGLRGAP